MDEKKDYHFCSSCVHFRATRTEQGVKTYCSRLGYDTKPNYKFHCWLPKEQVRKRMEASEPAP